MTVFRASLPLQRPRQVSYFVRGQEVVIMVLFAFPIGPQFTSDPLCCFYFRRQIAMNPGFVEWREPDNLWFMSGFGAFGVLLVFGTAWWCLDAVWYRSKRQTHEFKFNGAEGKSGMGKSQVGEGPRLLLQ